MLHQVTSIHLLVAEWRNEIFRCCNLSMVKSIGIICNFSLDFYLFNFSIFDEKMFVLFKREREKERGKIAVFCFFFFHSFRVSRWRCIRIQTSCGGFVLWPTLTGTHIYKTVLVFAITITKIATQYNVTPLTFVGMRFIGKCQQKRETKKTDTPNPKIERGEQTFAGGGNSNLNILISICSDKLCSIANASEWISGCDANHKQSSHWMRFKLPMKCLWIHWNSPERNFSCAFFLFVFFLPLIFGTFFYKQNETFPFFFHTHTHIFGSCGLMLIFFWLSCEIDRLHSAVDISMWWKLCVEHELNKCELKIARIFY